MRKPLNISHISRTEPRDQRVPIPIIPLIIVHYEYSRQQTQLMDKKQPINLAVFFSKGAFGDCARHSILHALNNESVGRIRIYSSSPLLLDESWWKCGCKQDHGLELKNSKSKNKLETIQVDPSNRKAMKSIDLSGVDAVISGLGNRRK